VTRTWDPDRGRVRGDRFDIRDELRRLRPVDPYQRFSVGDDVGPPVSRAGSFGLGRHGVLQIEDHGIGTGPKTRLSSFGCARARTGRYG
jgi:hypothetical protein